MGKGARGRHSRTQPAVTAGRVPAFPSIPIVNRIMQRPKIRVDPVLGDHPLRRGEVHHTSADATMQNPFQFVLLLGPVSVIAMPGLGPQVPFIRRCATKLQRDKVVLLIISHPPVGITERGKLAALDGRGVGRWWPDRTGQMWEADRGVDVGLLHGGVNCAQPVDCARPKEGFGREDWAWCSPCLYPAQHDKVLITGFLASLPVSAAVIVLTVSYGRKIG
jgi:hypothetical protein